MRLSGACEWGLAWRLGEEPRGAQLLPDPGLWEKQGRVRCN